jgi:hypothetical protein
MYNRFENDSSGVRILDHPEWLHAEQAKKLLDHDSIPTAVKTFSASLVQPLISHST